MTDADALALDRAPEEYRCAPLVEPARLEWARWTIARHWLYETADAIRLEALKASADSEIAGIAAKIDREELYHRMHAESGSTGCSPPLTPARAGRGARQLWPYALGVLDEMRWSLAAAPRRSSVAAPRRRAGAAGGDTKPSSRS